MKLNVHEYTSKTCMGHLKHLGKNTVIEHMKGKYKPKMAFLISYNNRQLSYSVFAL